MSSRTVQQIIHSKSVSDGAWVKLRRSLGQSQDLRLDPFLMLDEFSSMNPDDYLAGFPDHPHRGFETVTFMLDGTMLHQDHLGNKGLLESGGVQWMTAGRGIIHSEMPQQESGRMRGFQLLLNLPAKEKMKPAGYRDIKPGDIPVLHVGSGGQIKIIAGEVEIGGNKHSGPMQGLSTELLYLDVHLPMGEHLSIAITSYHAAIIYPYEGQVAVGTLIELEWLEAHAAGILSPGDQVEVRAGEGTQIFCCWLPGHCKNLLSSTALLS
jgi:redox-sensitive bicupin YhaK (pirin superfamily)